MLFDIYPRKKIQSQLFFCLLNSTGSQPHLLHMKEILSFSFHVSFHRKISVLVSIVAWFNTLEDHLEEEEVTD